MTELSRRGLMRTAVWTTPAVAIATAAPAFATSPKPIACAPCAVKHPGKPRDKAYTVYTNCTGGEPTAVYVDGKKGTKIGKGAYYFPGFNNSRSKRKVEIFKGSDVLFSGQISFPPYKGK